MKKIYQGTGFIDYAGYHQCIVLENKTTRVILGPHCGGRILEYSWKENNVIYLDPKQDGWGYTPGKPEIDPYGGRFDIGPEMTAPKHPLLWVGKWNWEIIGARAARLISQIDQATGVQLIREFRLDKDSSHLRCRQIMKNISKEINEYCYWSRTLACGDGICIVPMSLNSRFPHSYIMYGPGSVINYKPIDSKIKLRDGFLEITGPPANPKLGIDSYAGWLGYLLPDNLLFVKKFPVYPDRIYNEMAAITISIYYTDRLCELEPIGPRERLQPGDSASFIEDWWLLEYNFQSKLDLKRIGQFIQKVFKAGNSQQGLCA